jgi:hypothetical protein
LTDNLDSLGAALLAITDRLIDNRCRGEEVIWADINRPGRVTGKNYIASAGDGNLAGRAVPSVHFRIV